MIVYVVRPLPITSGGAALVLQAIIYVVDSSDTERIGTSAEEFHAILDEEELRDALILVYANKQACTHPELSPISRLAHLVGWNVTQ